MDTVLKKALEFSNYQKTLNNQISILKEKTFAKLHYGENGGLFVIDESLLSFVTILISQGRINNVPLISSNGVPIIIEDLIKFKEEIYDRYFSAINEYAIEYDKIKKSRNTSQLINL